MLILAYTLFFFLTISAQDANPGDLYPCIGDNCDATTICSATDLACQCQNTNYLQYVVGCTGRYCLPQDFDAIAEDFLDYCTSIGFPCPWSASQLVSVASSAASIEGSTSTSTGTSTPTGNSYSPPSFHFAQYNRVNRNSGSNH